MVVGGARSGTLQDQRLQLRREQLLQFLQIQLVPVPLLLRVEGVQRIKATFQIVFKSDGASAIASVVILVRQGVIATPGRRFVLTPTSLARFLEQ